MELIKQLENQSVDAIDSTRKALKTQLQSLLDLIERQPVHQTQSSDMVSDEVKQSVKYSLDLLAVLRNQLKTTPNEVNSSYFISDNAGSSQTALNESVVERIPVLIQHDQDWRKLVNAQPGISLQRITINDLTLYQHEAPKLLLVCSTFTADQPSLIFLLRYFLPHTLFISLNCDELSEGDAKSDCQQDYHYGCDDSIVLSSGSLSSMPVLKQKLARARAVSSLLSCVTHENPRVIKFVPGELHHSKWYFVADFEQILARFSSRESFHRDDAAKQLVMCSRHLNRKLNEFYPVNFKELLKLHRMRRALFLMGEGRQVAQLADRCGFSSPSWFSSSFKSVFNLTVKQADLVISSAGEI